MGSSPEPPVPLVISKFFGSPPGFDTQGYFYLERNAKALRLNEFTLPLSSVAAGLNCTPEILDEIVKGARRRIFYGLSDKVDEVDRAIAECKHMTAADAEVVRVQCILPMKAKLDALRGTIDELTTLLLACRSGANADMSRALFFQHILPCCVWLFPSKAYIAWIAEVAEYAGTF